MSGGIERDLESAGSGIRRNREIGSGIGGIEELAGENTGLLRHALQILQEADNAKLRRNNAALAKGCGIAALLLRLIRLCGSN
jgi:hypothetical protein